MIFGYMKDSITKLFGQPPFHLVALSGGKDSTAMSIALQERMPDISFKFYCTPTGFELPEMFDWWKRIGTILGSRLIPVMGMSLGDCIDKNKMLPNFRARFCTRQIKIEPAIRLLKNLGAIGPVFHYVGLRADEPTRLGGIYDNIKNVQSTHPFKDWGWGLKEVWGCLKDKGLENAIPDRTDCDICYHQRIGEWWLLWRDHLTTRWARGEGFEEKYNATFRTPGRDSWPTSMKALRERFESGDRPRGAGQSELFLSRQSMDGGNCRVCSL